MKSTMLQVLGMIFAAALCLVFGYELVKLLGASADKAMDAFVILAGLLALCVITGTDDRFHSKA